MTNAERFIGDEDLIDTFIDEFSEFAYSEDMDFKYHYLKETLTRFFKASVKPILTEDERVILRNINTNVYDVIGRDLDFDLYIAGKVDWKGNKVSTKDNIEQFLKDNVFQFIKERRRILNRGVVKQ